MKHHAFYGYDEFVLCLAYKGDIIREYFYNYEVRNRDCTMTLGSREIKVHNNHTESNEDGTVGVFREKPQIDEGRINGGFFVADVCSNMRSN